jgi:hypothetical protein
MAKASEVSSESRQNQYMLAKLLFTKYGVLHSFHELQLKYWPIACCNISIDGYAMVEPNLKKVTYWVYTKKYYKLSAEGTVEIDGSVSYETKPVKRSKFSPLKLIYAPGKKYKNEMKQAFINLETWTQDMLWPDTTVEMYYDEQKYNHKK